MNLIFEDEVLGVVTPSIGAVGSDDAAVADMEVAAAEAEVAQATNETEAFGYAVESGFAMLQTMSTSKEEGWSKKATASQMQLQLESAFRGWHPKQSEAVLPQSRLLCAESAYSTSDYFAESWQGVKDFIRRMWEALKRAVKKMWAAIKGFFVKSTSNAQVKQNDLKNLMVELGKLKTKDKDECDLGKSLAAMCATSPTQTEIDAVSFKQGYTKFIDSMTDGLGKAVYAPKLNKEVLDFFKQGIQSNRTVTEDFKSKYEKKSKEEDTSWKSGMFVQMEVIKTMGDIFGKKSVNPSDALSSKMKTEDIDNLRNHLETAVKVTLDVVKFDATKLARNEEHIEKLIADIQAYTEAETSIGYTTAEEAQRVKDLASFSRDLIHKHSSEVARSAATLTSALLAATGVISKYVEAHTRCYKKA